ncbi:MAG: ABC transporter permease, partial [Treponemataceae bacterium]
MNTLVKIAFRNLNRQKKRTFLLGGAIAFGILIVTVINGFAGAFQANVAGNMAQLFAGHVFVEGVEKTP